METVSTFNTKYQRVFMNAMVCSAAKEVSQQMLLFKDLVVKTVFMKFVALKILCKICSIGFSHPGINTRFGNLTVYMLFRTYSGISRKLTTRFIV